MIRLLMLLMALAMLLFSACPAGWHDAGDRGAGVSETVDAPEASPAEPAAQLTPGATAAPTEAPVQEGLSTQGGENETSMVTDF